MKVIQKVTSWINPLHRKILPEEDPMDIVYWKSKGYKYPNIMTVAYRWGQIDDEGNPLPEPHQTREEE